MSHLVLVFLGQFQVCLADQTVTSFESDKVRALLAYLTVESAEANGQAMLHSRSALAALLWSGYSEESARASLRQTLYHLRKSLGDDHATVGQALPFLLINRQTIQLNPNADCQVDVRRFLDLLAACAAHPHEQIECCQPCLQHLRQAVDLYRGDFLAGFSVVDSDSFEEWRRITQEHLHLQALNALTHLAHAAEAAGEAEQALQDARRQLALEPWREEAHRQVMRLLAQCGQRAAALAQYNTCRQVLTEELGVEPEEATLVLVEQIRSGEFDKVTRRQGDKVTEEHPVTLSPLHDWGEMPAVDFFAGRAAEVAQLSAWLTVEPKTDTPRGRLVSVLGIGGIGKTTLAATVTKAVVPNFTVVIWRSLLNAPPPAEILRSWLQTLSRQTLTTLPESLDEQLRLLLDYLRQTRCLLVLDNVESIFHGNDSQGRAGVTRPGYEGYDSLFQRLAESDHQSCLLLTSREQPYALMRLGRQAQVASGRLRILPLTGLDLTAGHELLQSNGLHTSTAEVTRLIENYSGNPLALQIAAATIVDFFDGDVTAFQQEQGGIFDGIRTVLDQQFARLSALERDILVWLAIEREAVPVQTLRSNLVHPVATYELLEALQSLQNRSLLEKSATGLTLQNVIIEYATEYLVEQICREIAEGAEFGVRSAEVSALQIPYSALNRFALMKAQAKEYVRQSQLRLIVQPIAERLQARWGKASLAVKMNEQLAQVRAAPPRTPGYAAGNLLTLLRHWRIDCTGYNFSQLCVWGVDFRGIRFAEMNFTEADLAYCTFILTIKGFALKLRADEELFIGDLAHGDVILWVLTRAHSLYSYHRWHSNGGNPMVFNQASTGGPLFLAGGGLDFAIRVWSVADHTLLHTLTGHRDSISALALNDSGTLLASGSEDQTICLWDLQSGKLRQTLLGHSGAISALTFAPLSADLSQDTTGDILFSSSRDEAVRRRQGRRCCVRRRRQSWPRRRGKRRAALQH